MPNRGSSSNYSQHRTNAAMRDFAQDVGFDSSFFDTHPHSYRGGTYSRRDARTFDDDIRFYHRATRPDSSHSRSYPRVYVPERVYGEDPPIARRPDTRRTVYTEDDSLPRRRGSVSHRRPEPRVPSPSEGPRGGYYSPAPSEPRPRRDTDSRRSSPPVPTELFMTAAQWEQADKETDYYMEHYFVAPDPRNPPPFEEARKRFMENFRVWQRTDEYRAVRERIRADIEARSRYSR